MIGWIYIAGLVVLLIVLLCVFIRGADENSSRLTLDEYYNAVEEQS